MPPMLGLTLRVFVLPFLSLALLSCESTDRMLKATEHAVAKGKTLQRSPRGGSMTMRVTLNGCSRTFMPLSTNSRRCTMP
jgi:hypothetical protein